MDIFLYLLFGFFDIFALQILAFKIFRFPVREYIREFLTIALTLSLTSFILRIQFDLQDIDVGIQMLLMIIFFRYWLKITIHNALVISTIGLLAVIIIQLGTNALLSKFQIVGQNDWLYLTDMGTYIIQMSSEFFVFLICWLIYKFNLGFSFIMRPPHNIYLKEKIEGTNKAFLIGTIIGAILVFIHLYWLHNFLREYTTIVLLAVLSLLALIITAFQKEREDCD